VEDEKPDGLEDDATLPGIPPSKAAEPAVASPELEPVSVPAPEPIPAITADAPQDIDPSEAVTREMEIPASLARERERERFGGMAREIVIPAAPAREPEPLPAVTREAEKPAIVTPQPEPPPVAAPATSEPAVIPARDRSPAPRVERSRGPRPNMLELREPLYRETGGYRLLLDPPDLARLRELPGSKEKTDRELGEQFFDAHAARLTGAVADDVPAPAELRVVVDPFSRQAFLALGRTIRGIVSF
jgi:hypothetical protein